MRSLTSENGSNNPNNLSKASSEEEESRLNQSAEHNVQLPPWSPRVYTFSRVVNALHDNEPVRIICCRGCYEFRDASALDATVLHSFCETCKPFSKKERKRKKGRTNDKTLTCKRKDLRFLYDDGKTEIPPCRSCRGYYFKDAMGSPTACKLSSSTVSSYEL